MISKITPFIPQAAADNALTGAAKTVALVGLLLAVVTLAACGGGTTNNDPENQQETLAGAEPGQTDAEPEQSDPEQTVNEQPEQTAPANTTPFAGEITEVILVTGQSNALGADTDYDMWLDEPNDRVFAFTNEGWLQANLRQIWDQNWHPRGDPSTDPSNNFGFHFAKKVAQQRSHRSVGIILVTAPGAPIVTWDYESDFYLSIRNRVISALNQLPSKATVDGILWHQGETDWEDTPFYESKLADVINNFRSESWFGMNKPFICGETANAPLNRILNNLNNDGDPWTACVGADGLDLHPDQVHFTAEGLREIGARYGLKYLEMIER